MLLIKCTPVICSVTINMNSQLEKHLVSVIMPCFNSSKYIEQSIDSVLSQRYRNIELIIIDDASTDNSIDIINSYTDHRIKLITLDKNHGAGFARNKGIDLANGRFIAFLDSDDIWKENKLELQIPFMLENRYALTYTYYQQFSAIGIGKKVQPPLSVNYNELVYCNVIGCLTAVYDTILLGKQYMPLIRKRQDMGLWLNILSQCDIAYCLPHILSEYRTDSGMTKNKLSAAKSQWLFYRTELKFGILKTLITFIKYAYKGIIKKYI